MNDALMISEVTRRCLASLSRCFRDGNNARSTDVMKAQVREIARDISMWHLSGEAKARMFLRPLEEILVNHYGAVVGRRLYWDFVDAFWLQSWSSVPLVLNGRAPTVEPASDCRRRTDQGDSLPGQSSAILG